MAKKLCNVLVNKYNGQNVFQVWMDDDIAETVLNIPGVLEVKHNHGYYHVMFDPRYDWEELKSEIEQLANSYAED